MASSNVIRDLGVGLAVTALVLVIVVMVPVIMNIQNIRDNKKRIEFLARAVQPLVKYTCNPSMDGISPNTCVMDPNGTLSYGDCVVSQANNCGIMFDCDTTNGGCDYSKPSTTGKNILSDCQNAVTMKIACPKK